jgi:predicted ester cyclase
MRETAVAIHRIADGRIVEHWSDRDDLALMQQLGVISLPSS